MADAGSQVVRSLFVTLRRGYAGTPWFHRRILEALGLKTRHQCVEKPNNSTIRGMLSKVPHLVTIETDRMYALRSLRAYHEQLNRPPWVLHHDPPLLEQASLTHTQPALAPAASLPSPGPPGSADAAAATAASAPTSVAAAAAASEASQPPLTPFARAQLREHVWRTGMKGFAATGLRPLPPRRYFVEQQRQRRARVLTEQGMFSGAAVALHRQELTPKKYRRRTGIRD